MNTSFRLKSIDQRLHLTFLLVSFYFDPLIVFRATSFYDVLSFEMNLYLLFISVPLFKVVLMVYQSPLLMGFLELEWTPKLMLAFDLSSINRKVVTRNLTLHFWFLSWQPWVNIPLVIRNRDRSPWWYILLEYISITYLISINPLTDIKAHDLKLVNCHFVSTILVFL